MASTAFYTLVDRRFFLGAVALVNSLRRAGHKEQIVVVDAGLDPDQVELLKHECLVVKPAQELHPVQGRAIALESHQADLRVYVDSDVIVTRNLSELVEQGQAGRFVGFVDWLDPLRFHPAWKDIPHLAHLKERRHRYLNAGFFVLPSGGVWDEVFAAYKAGLEWLDLTKTSHGSATEKATLMQQVSELGEDERRELLLEVDRKTPSFLDFTASYTAARNVAYMGLLRNAPFYGSDQDVLNAALNAFVPGSDVLALAHELAPWPRFPGLVGSWGDLHYSDGQRPYLLHCVGLKTWLVPSPRTAYSDAMTKLLEEGPLVPKREDVPLFVRPGLRAHLNRRRQTLSRIAKLTFSGSE